MPEIFNTQRKIQIEIEQIREFASRSASEIPEAADKDFSIAFVPDRRMKQLNELFRGINSTTDVLSFPHEHDDFLSEPHGITGGSEIPSDISDSSDFLGDIVISAEQAQKQAAENGLTLEGEIKQLILHGLLHLCGYDHEIDSGEMDVRELELRERLNI